MIFQEVARKIEDMATRHFVPNSPRLSKSLSTSNYMFGVRQVARVLVVGFLALGLPSHLRANQPVLGPPVEPEETLLLLDMSDGNVQQSTLEAAMQGLLRSDFGYFRASFVLGWAVRYELVSEERIRSAFRAYGCDRSTAKTWFGCRHALETFEVAMQIRPTQKVQVPPCIHDGANLFSTDYRVFSEAVYRSFGDPETIALVRSVPPATLRDAFMPPPGSVVLNGPRDVNPSLFCTIDQWRSTNAPPTRWLAILMARQCQARP